jgi:hypothetical protein
MKKKTKSKAKPAVRKASAVKPKARKTTVPRRAKNVRTVTIITGLKAGDPEKLGPQPTTMANLALDFGRVDRRTFLQELERSIKTVQPVGRLFSFHKTELIEGGFIKVSKVSRDEWVKESEKPASKATPSAAEANSEVPAPTPAPVAEEAREPVEAATA